MVAIVCKLEYMPIYKLLKWLFYGCCRCDSVLTCYLFLFKNCRMSQEIKVGDCVLLKHGNGGIRMTVDSFFTYQGQKRARRKWYNEAKKEFEELATGVEALKLCESGSIPPR